MYGGTNQEYMVDLRTAESIKKNMVDHNKANLSGKKYRAVPSDAHDRSLQVAFFTHSVKTRANRVKFANQSLCNPKISTLLKAVRRGFLNEFPNLS